IPVARSALAHPEDLAARHLPSALEAARDRNWDQRTLRSQLPHRRKKIPGTTQRHPARRDRCNPTHRASSARLALADLRLLAPLADRRFRGGLPSFVALPILAALFPLLAPVALPVLVVREVPADLAPRCRSRRSPTPDHFRSANFLSNRRRNFLATWS